MNGKFKWLVLTMLCCFVPSAAEAVDLTADFDSFTEGVLGTSFMDGGISFVEAKGSPGGSDIDFIIEDASGTSLFTSSGSAFSSPNVLSSGGYSPGPSAGLSAQHGFSMDPGGLANAISIEGFFARRPDPATAHTVTLELTLGGTFAASTSLDLTTFASPFESHNLSINGVLFDKATIYGTGGSGPNEGRFGGAFDNVLISVVPEPASAALWILASFVFLSARRR
jgi:hypothetical protein